MKVQVKKAILLGGAMCMVSAMAGCYGYGYGSYGRMSQIPKTTAARDTLEEFDLASLQAEDGRYQMEGLPWGSSQEEVEEFFGQIIQETIPYSDGGGYGDMNYSLLLMDKISVGLMPVFDENGGLICLTFYFENTYTAEELDTYYADLVKTCSGIFGEADEIVPSEKENRGNVYSGETTCWYHEVSETEMTSFQIGKVDSGNGTDAVIMGINTYDPADAVEETTLAAE